MGLGLGMGELVFVFLIVLLLFGAKRLPEVGSSLGKGIREFKSSVSEIERELKVPDTPSRRMTAAPDSEPASLKDKTDTDKVDGPPVASDAAPAAQQ